MCTDAVVQSSDLNVVYWLAAKQTRKKQNCGAAVCQLPRWICLVEATAEAVCLGTLVPPVCVSVSLKCQGLWFVISWCIYIGHWAVNVSTGGNFPFLSSLCTLWKDKWKICSLCANKTHNEVCYLWGKKQNSTVCAWSWTVWAYRSLNFLARPAGSAHMRTGLFISVKVLLLPGMKRQNEGYVQRLRGTEGHEGPCFHVCSQSGVPESTADDYFSFASLRRFVLGRCTKHAGCQNSPFWMVW